jgi:hypothetical protein
MCAYIPKLFSFLLFFLTYTFPSFRRYDIATKVPAAQLPLVLGGEMSMWTDSYCYIDQCGSSTGRVPTGHALFDPAQDAAFGKSIGGMIWPRGFVGAAAFWNYNNATNPADPAFVASIYKLNDEVKARGGFVCATNCSCNQNTQCGVPYIQTPAPTAGSIATMMPCAVPPTAQRGSICPGVSPCLQAHSPRPAYASTGRRCI